VFKEATLAVIRFCGNLSVLFFCAPSVLSSGTPSWVVDWTNTENFNDLRTLEHGFEAPHCVVTIDDNSLRLRGILLDTVEHCSAAMSDFSFFPELTDDMDVTFEESTIRILKNIVALRERIQLVVETREQPMMHTAVKRIES
jgi:hypothetical protein